MKLAVAISNGPLRLFLATLTICGRVQHNEASVDLRRVLARLPFNRVGMSSQAVSRLVEIYIVVGPVERPQRSNTGASTAYNGHLFPRDTRVSRKAHDGFLLLGSSQALRDMKGRGVGRP